MNNDCLKRTNSRCNHRSQAELDSTYCSCEKQGFQGQKLEVILPKTV